MFISLSIPSAINCSLISLSLQDLWFPVNRVCIFTLTTTKQERVVIINGRGVFLIFRGSGHAGFQLNFNIIIIKAYFPLCPKLLGLTLNLSSDSSVKQFSGSQM